jgi:hypothetical protein
VKRTLFGPVFLAVLLAPFLARALSFDLTGQVLKNGGRLIATGTDTLPAVPLYKVTLDVTGTATGSFAQFLGSGVIDLRTALTSHFSASLANNVMNATLANLSARLPAVLAVGPASQFYFVVSGTTLDTLSSRGNFLVKLDRNGKFTGSITREGFSLRVGRKKMPFTGTFTALSGTVAIQPALASSTNAQPDIMVMANPHIAIGNDVYVTSPNNASIIPFYATVPQRHTHKTTFLIQNDGSATDSFLFKSGTLPTGFTFHAFDGTTDITSQVQGSGFPISNLASGAVKAVTVKVTVGTTATRRFFDVVPFAAQRSTDSNSIDWAGASIHVP